MNLQVSLYGFNLSEWTDAHGSDYYYYYYII